jgi:hypothetical protein
MERRAINEPCARISGARFFHAFWKVIVLDFGKITETRFFGFMCHLTYAPATLRRRLKNLVSVGSLSPFSVFAKL